MERADEMYQAGLESLVAQSQSIVTGQVSDYASHVLRSDPGSGTPLLWEIQGQVRLPRSLQGSAPGTAIHFTRLEQAIYMGQPEKSPWELEYLRWQAGDSAVIFFTSAGMRVYPSGRGERDLAAQVSRIATVQAIGDPEARFEAWRQELQPALPTEEQQAALRSLVAFRKDWTAMQLIFAKAIESPNHAVRSFVVGLVAYGIRREQWSSPMEPAKFLCARLTAETDANQALRYLGSFGPLLLYAHEQQHWAQRADLREHLDRCLLDRCQSGSSEMVEACNDLRSRFQR